MKKKLLAIILVFTTTSSFAWNATGHKVIARIAYEHLSPQAKAAVDHLTFTQEDQVFTGQSRFQYISTWADYTRAQGDHRFDQWHYIGLPLSADRTPVKPPKNPNVVWAIQHAEKVLKDPLSTDMDKQLYLKLLVHFVADVHQPLHTVNRYSRYNKSGDGGGNAVKIKAPYANNLHKYWDEGVGLFRKHRTHYPKLRSLGINHLATLVETQHPIETFDPTVLNSSPILWAEEGRKIASEHVYSLRYGSRPKEEYVIKSQQIVMERLALSAYRLATLLNTIYEVR